MPTANGNDPRVRGRHVRRPDAARPVQSDGQMRRNPQKANRVANTQQIRGANNPRLRAQHTAARQQQSAHAVRRDNPTTGLYAQDLRSGENYSSKRKMNKRKKIAIGVLSAILVAVLGIGAAGALYYNSIKDGLGYDGDIDSLKGALADADYGEPFYVLVIGSDNWEDYGARSDAMVLARVDLNDAQVTMVSVPRDTPYQVGDETVKLNWVFESRGEVACIEAVSELTGVDITHYVEVEFDQLEHVVDALGGVEVNVPYSFNYQVYTKDEPVIHVDKGKQVLTGEQAVAFARMRTAYTESGISHDAIRQANIRAMMVGMIKQILSNPVSEIPGQVQTLAGMVQTDIPLADLIAWATSLAQAEEVTLYTCTGPTEGGLDSSTGLWLTDEAPEKWAELMGVVDAGGDPSVVELEVDESADGRVQLNSSEVVSS